MPTVPVTPKVVAWAVEQSGYSLDEIANSLDTTVATVRAWMAGTEAPKVGEARALAKKLRRPFAFLLWPEPPKTVAPDVAFRAPISDAMRELNASERRFIRQASRLQTLLAQLREEDPSISAVPTIAPKTEPEDAAEVARKWLSISLEQQIAWDSEYEALREWRARFEQRGVFVFFLALGEDACRGITLASERAPVIVVNTAFNARARIYSLFHELAHVMTRTTSACAASLAPRTEIGGGLERWCEQFAADTLMPRTSIDKFVTEKRWVHPLDELTYANAIARRYKVSIPAAALRLITSGHATWKLWNHLPKRVDEKGSGGAPPEEPRTTPIVRLGEFGQSAARMIVDGVQKELLERSQAQSYLRVDANSFDEIERRVVAAGATTG